MKLLLFIFFLGILNLAPGQSANFQFPDSIESELKKYNGNIIIKKGNSVLYQKINSANDSSLHQIGEVSQTFLAHFINHIAANHQIKTSDPLSKYIHDFPYSNITIEHLLKHQSGLPLNYMKLYHRNYYIKPTVKKDRIIRVDNHDIFDVLVNVKPELSFIPGSKFEFNNLNYILLTKLLETVTFTPLNGFAYRYFDHNDFTFEPKVVFETDSIFNKTYGLNPNGQLMDNLQHIGFPYADATIGHQNMYLSNIELALWLTFLYDRFDFEFLKTKNSNWVEGFYFDGQLSQLYAKGIFLAHETFCLIDESNYILAMNSWNSSNNENEKLFESIRSYIAQLN
jgi:hypothetical protein